MFIIILVTALGGGSFLGNFALLAYFIGYNSMMWAGFVLTFILMAKAYLGVFKVPGIGSFAEDFAGSH
jgi:uncharacterized membrane protein